MNIKNLIIISQSFIIAILVYINFFHVNTYEDCILAKMKGQNNNLTFMVRKVCLKEYPRQQDINTKIVDPFSTLISTKRGNTLKLIEHVIGVMAVLGLVGTAVSYGLTQNFVKRISDRLVLRFFIYSTIGCLIGPIVLFVTNNELGPRYLGDVFIYFIVGMIIIWLLFAPLYGFRQFIDHKNKSDRTLS